MKVASCFFILAALSVSGAAGVMRTCTHAGRLLEPKMQPFSCMGARARREAHEQCQHQPFPLPSLPDEGWAMEGHDHNMRTAQYGSGGHGVLRPMHYI